jgi:hypothetical protein
MSDKTTYWTVQEYLYYKKTGENPAKATKKSSMKLMLAIDPGASGGLAWKRDGEQVEICKMPATVKDLVEKLDEIVPYPRQENGVMCLIEKVGAYMPGNSGPAAAKFARHCGMLEGVLVAMNIPFQDVTPAKWEHSFIGKPNWPKIDPDIPDKTKKKIRSERKAKRKNMIKEKAQRLNPHLNITLATSDAVGMLAYLQMNG